jgi:hypothetical protein
LQRAFVFSIGEQQTFRRLGFSPPRRCRSCKALVKAQAEWAKQPRATRGPRPGDEPAQEER